MVGLRQLQIITLFRSHVRDYNNWQHSTSRRFSTNHHLDASSITITRNFSLNDPPSEFMTTVNASSLRTTSTAEEAPSGHLTATMIGQPHEALVDVPSFNKTCSCFDQATISDQVLLFPSAAFFVTGELRELTTWWAAVVLCLQRNVYGYVSSGGVRYT